MPFSIMKYLTIVAFVLHSLAGVYGHCCSCEATFDEHGHEAQAAAFSAGVWDAQFPSAERVERSSRCCPCHCPGTCTCCAAIPLERDCGEQHHCYHYCHCSECALLPEHVAFFSGLEQTVERLSSLVLSLPVIEDGAFFSFFGASDKTCLVLPSRPRLHLFLERFLI